MPRLRKSRLQPKQVLASRQQTCLLSRCNPPPNKEFAILLNLFGHRENRDTVACLTQLMTPRPKAQPVRNESFPHTPKTVFIEPAHRPPLLIDPEKLLVATTRILLDGRLFTIGARNIRALLGPHGTRKGTVRKAQPGTPPLRFNFGVEHPEENTSEAKSSEN